MAHTNLTVLSDPEFPQGIFFALDRSTDRIIQLVDRVLEKSLLSSCDYHTPESSWGACDGYPCHARATVHDLVTDQEYCARHFAETARG